MKRNYCLFFLLGCLFFAASLHGEIILTNKGKSSYSILLPSKATPMEQLAARELKTYLKKSTGADLAIVEKVGENNIRLARNKNLGRDESRISINGKELLLEGGDEWGVIYSVYAFLENQLGIRWFTPYGDEKVPKYETLKLDFKAYKEQPALEMRGMVGSEYYRHKDASIFFFRNRLNMGNNMRIKAYPGTKPRWFYNGYACHTFFYYIPPAKGIYPQNLKFKEEKYYFKSNPEFFSMNEQGKRVYTLQLCFSNKALRKEFTRRFEEYLSLSGKKGIYTISAQDWPGSFCYCPDCKALEKKYQCNVGPLMDYLIELCSLTEKKYPQILIKTSAYRKDQSEKPPVLAPGKKLPRQLLIDFGPIDDDFTKSITHKNNMGTYKNLKDYCKIANRVLLYHWPIVYGGGHPFGGFYRVAEDTKMAYQTGLKAAFYEHNVGTMYGWNTVDLMTYLILKLYQKPDLDYKKVIREFCEFYYGNVAEEMLSYIQDLEDISANNPSFHPWNGGIVPAVAAEKNLIKWTKLFNAMEKKCASDPISLKRVKDARIQLDKAVMAFNFKTLREKYPDIIPPADKLMASIKEATADSMKRRYPDYARSFRDIWHKRALAGLADLYMGATVTPKPLSPELEKLPKKYVRQTYAVVTNKCPLVKDPEAAFGQAIYDHKIKKAQVPFYCGIYDTGRKKRLVTKGIKASEIVPDKYHLYKLGSFPIPENAQIFTGSTWICSISLKKFFRIGEAMNKKYDIYISMKFEGKGYHKDSKKDVDRVYIDRAVVVENPEK